MAYGYDPHLAEILRSVQSRLNAPSPQPDYAGMLRATQQRLGPQGPGSAFELGPTGPLQTASVPNFQLGPTGPLQTAGRPMPTTGFGLGETGPLVTAQRPYTPNFELGPTGPTVTPRGPIGQGPSGIFNVEPNVGALPLEATPRVTYGDLRQSMFGPRLEDHTGSSMWNTVTPETGMPATATTNVSSIPQGVAAPSELELAALRSNQGALPTWMGQGSGEAAAGAGSNFLNSGLLGSDVAGGLASKSFGKFGNIGAAIGIPLASQALAGHISDPTQAANVRAAGNVAGQGAWLTPMIAGHLGIAGVGTLPGIGAAAAGGALAQGFSATDVGNKTINQMRGQDTGNGPADYAAAAAQGLFGALPLVGRAAEKLGFINGSTDNTVADVLGGGSDNAPKANATPQVTPEQRLAASSPEALTKLASDYGLSGPMTQKLIKNYNQALVMAKQQGAVSLPADKDGKLSDGTNAADYPGAKKITDAKGNVQWVTTNPADIQQTVFDQATQLVPTLGASQDQEEDFFRKQAVMQAQLEQVLPQLYNPAIWGSDPTAQTLAMAEARAIPSRYVQAQALQAQQAYDNQIAQAMQQQQLAQQHPELFGKKSSSGQPTTLDAAMAQ